MKLLTFVPSFLRNKFLIAGVAFIVWMLFFDKNDFFAQKELRDELYELNKSKAFFVDQIQQERKFSKELSTNPATIEKFAREQYLMKRDGEDIYIIQPAENK
jgi:cell division protein FtsB